MTVTNSSADDTATDNTPTDLVTVTIDDVEVSVPKGTLVIRAAELVGVEIPRFCDHPLLEPVGACRQCLVEIPDAGNGRAMPKPQASCTLEVAPGMEVRTQVSSPVAEKAQQGTMEFLLINHPLDCPVCDKGGECPLQNQAMSHGRGEARFTETKRTFPKPINVSAQVLLDRERCVLCARCTRFSEEIAGDPFIALLDRGARQQVGIAEEEPFHSYFSGNTIQICPVGALTSADYRFRSRPFDLVSTPAVAEHDACGAAIRVDHRRGKVMRRLAGDDPEVNEEWITDKDRFCFTWSSQDRLSHPMVRGEDGGLEPASWPAALAAAARGLADCGGRVGVLPGGHLTAEDAFAYSVFARTVLRTNDIDFRSRAHSDEEASFLASHVAGSPLLTYRDLERASRIVVIGLEPEDEAGTIFLRLRKAVRKNGLRVVALASHASRGLTKLGGELVPTIPGAETESLRGLALDDRTVILAGERLAGVPGALTAVLDAAQRTGARLAWVPRRAGDRGAVETGCLPGLLPGGRPVTEAEARADLAAAWGVSSLPAKAGRATTAMLDAARRGTLQGLLVGGVEVADLPDPQVARAALEGAFVVSLEVRDSEVTRAADVVLPIAATVEKPGTYVTWEGRLRSFDTAIERPGALTDTRVLAGIAEEMGTDLGFRSISGARAAMRDLGGWDGIRAAAPLVSPSPGRPDGGQVVLDTWRQMIDDGRGQDGQPQYRATARPAVLRLSADTAERHGVDPAGAATLETPRGRATFAVELTTMPDDVVWAPANSGINLLATLGAGYGSLVTLRAARPEELGPDQTDTAETRSAEEVNDDE